MQVLDQREGGAGDIYPGLVGDGLSEQTTRTLVWCRWAHGARADSLAPLHDSCRPGILLIGGGGVWLARCTRAEEAFGVVGWAGRECVLAPRGGSWD
jgi:hypothetical protein